MQSVVLLEEEQEMRDEEIRRDEREMTKENRDGFALSKRKQSRCGENRR